MKTLATVRYLSFFVLLIFPLSSAADTVVAHYLHEGKLLLALENGAIQITPLNNAAVEVRYVEQHSTNQTSHAKADSSLANITSLFEDTQQGFPSFALADSVTLAALSHHFTLVEHDAMVEALSVLEGRETLEDREPLEGRETSPNKSIKDGLANTLNTLNTLNNSLNNTLNRVSATTQKPILEFASKDLQIKITRQPFHLQFWQGNKRLSEHDSGFFEHRTMRGVRFKLNDHERIFGGGQRVLGMDRRGYRLPLQSKTDWGYTNHSEAMYYSLPGIFSSHGYAILFDNSSIGYLDIGKSEQDVLQFEADSGRNAYLFVTGNTYPAITSNITSITGKQPLPPRWAFGNLSSRFGYRSEQDVRDVVNAYKEQDFPLDAMILDLYWFGKTIKGHMGSLDWDRETFPTGEQMIEELAAQDINTILITEPYVINSSKQWQNGIQNHIFAQNLAGDTRVIDMYFGPAGLIDVFQPKAQDWFWQHYERLFKQGVAGVWGDLGEPEAHPENTVHLLQNKKVTANEVHNAFGHEWARLIAENYQQFAPNQRLFLLMRSGFLGSQRFGMLPWTGDVSRSWGGLAAQVELSLQMSLFGLAYTHSDLGGFAGFDEFDAELYIRWLQYGVFQPVYRLHGIESVAPEPIFHDKNTQDVVRKAIKWRYRLLPYHYSMAYQNSTTGMPLMRPHFYDLSAIPDVAQNKSQSSAQNKFQGKGKGKNSTELYPEFTTRDSYFWGDAFWIKPITQANMNAIDVSLPSGHWFDFWSDAYHEGGTTHTIAVELSHIPAFVKAGSFIPMSPAINNTAHYRGDDITLHYYHHPKVNAASGVWYEDDGKSADSLEKQNHRLFNLRASYGSLPSSSNRQSSSPSQLSENLLLELTANGNGYQDEPQKRSVTWLIHNVQQAPERIIVNGLETTGIFKSADKTLAITTEVTPSTRAVAIDISW